ncbi:hypothetical protein D3C77_626780 [compost metagenome]
MPDAIKRQLQALHCRQHRDCRGDHAVAVEQRRAKQAEQHQHPAQTRIGCRRAPRQSGQRHDAALALVVGTQHEQYVFDRDHPDQRPEHQRQNAQHAVMVGLHAVMTGEDFFEGVQRAGADVAINHADGGDEQAD